MGIKRAARGFTLIELLIVVAIIAILAAIVTINMLEAQTRSKVSRAHSDLRTLQTALEAYRTDETSYPDVASLFTPFSRRLRVLTTPVAYISSIPSDPFFSATGSSPENLEPYYCYAPGNLYHGGASAYGGFDYRGTIYSVASRGPDQKILAGGYCMAHPAAYESHINIEGLYDPTNGTVSAGDIFHLGAGRK